MEMPSHQLPSRPRDFIDLISDDEEGDDAGLEPLSPHAGRFPELDDFADLDDLIFGNLVRDNQAAWDAAEFEAQGVPIPVLGDWRDGVPRPVAEAAIVPPALAPDLPQMFRQAERLKLDAPPVDAVNQVNKQANNELLDNDNDLIQDEVNNQLNNDLLDENDLILEELNNQLLDKQINNHNNADNFVWPQVNLDRHNPRKPIDFEPAEEMDVKARCLEGVVDIFPDICLEYIDQLYTSLQGRKTVPAIVERVLQGEEEGRPYPKLKQLKRKRPVESDEEEEIKRKYTVNQDHTTDKYLTLARGMLSEDFASTPMSFIMKEFHDSGMVIYTTYQKLAEAERLWDPKSPSYHKLKQARRPKHYIPLIVEEKLADLALPPDQKRAYSELKDVRIGREKWEVKFTAQRQREADEAAAKEKYEADEAANLELAMKEGTMDDCGCCYDEFPRNRMIHCNNESISHYFCKRCARLHAETQIGSAKYELQCMSTDVCGASYSHSQREIFLDQNLTTALDRIEAETVLRLAGIENLASCPFCSYAAEYPPIEDERLFHCQRDTCAKTSCRLCQKESHIPKTCRENAKDIGLDVRREVEEAMTAAMVRLCNKCKGPFIKEDGCNKMNCPCGNIQCYVCSQSCQYNHFDDERRGGKTGNCPLFDDVNKRHEDETKRAEETIVEKLQKEHPEITREDLEIRVSDAVKADEAKRRKRRLLPHEGFGFQLPAEIERREFPGPALIMGNEERQAYRDAFRANLPPRLAFGAFENAANQARNPQGGAADPANRPAHRFLNREPRPLNPNVRDLLDAARGVLENREANGEEGVEAIVAAEADRRELRDQLAGEYLDAPLLHKAELRERIAALDAVGVEAAEALRAARAARDAVGEPRRGEDGDAEVIYRPGDRVVPRRRMQDWVFEPFGPPPDGEDGEEAGEEAGDADGGGVAGNAGNAGNAGKADQASIAARATKAVKAVKAIKAVKAVKAIKAAKTARAVKAAKTGKANKARDVAHEEDIAQTFAPADRPNRPPNGNNFILRPNPPRHREQFMLPRHPPRPDSPPAMSFEALMGQLGDYYDEPNPPRQEPAPMMAQEEYMGFLNDDGYIRQPPNKKKKEAEGSAGRGRFSQALGMFREVERARGGGEGGIKQEDGEEGGDKLEGGKMEGGKQEGGRREGERGLDFLMRLRRARSKSEKKEKAKGEEKK